MSKEILYSPHGIDSKVTAEETSNKLFDTSTWFPLFDQLGKRKVTPPLNLEGIMLKIEEDDSDYGMFENKRIDAGWTYFGQFMTHDLTIRRELGDTRPRLNLDCLYGFGPKSSGHLYEMEKDPDNDHAFRGVRFVFDPYINTTGDKVDDVFRIGRRKNIPVMADVRNDDNFLLNQLHCAFMRFHNRIAEYFFKRDGGRPETLFKRTRKFVTWTYQWLIVNEYLKLLTGDVADGLICGDLYKILSKIDPYIQEPILMPEFIVAALRMGHSQVRSFYHLSRLSILPLYEKNTLNKPDLRGFVRDCRRGPVDWRFFFTFEPSPKAQKSRPIDLIIAPPLSQLPFFERHDPNRDLSDTDIRRSIENNMILRECDLEIIREQLGIDTIESFHSALDELYTDKPEWDKWQRCKEALLNLDGWPLWLFILLESRIKGVDFKEMVHVKQKLGPLGAQIVAEQLVWILQKEQDGYLCQKIDWHPMKELPRNYVPVRTDQPNLFSIADVLYIAEHGIYF